MENKEKYKSCPFLEFGLHIASDGIRHCCYISENFIDQPYIPYDENEDFDDYILRFINQKKQIIEDNKNGIKTLCTNCPNLREGYWETDKKIKLIHFALDHSCNIKCKY